MNPENPNSFDHRYLSLPNGRKYHLVDQLPENYDHRSNPTLLCIHGFPDCWAGWKHQIKPWVENGCRVVVPDMLGYGQTDKPDHPEEYSLKKISGDLELILSECKVESAFVIGHDWGSHIAGRFALYHSERVRGVVHISIGFFAPNSSEPVPHEVAVKNEIYEYQLYFASETCVEQLQAKLANFFKLAFNPNVFSGPKGIPTDFGSIVPGDSSPDPRYKECLLNDKELEYIVSQNKTMRGPTNYYRTWDLRWKEEREGAGLDSTYKEGTPVLFLRGSSDATSTQEVMEATKNLSNSEVISYGGAGHWLMLERKEQVTKDVLSWLRKAGLHP